MKKLSKEEKRQIQHEEEKDRIVNKLSAFKILSKNKPIQDVVKELPISINIRPGWRREYDLFEFSEIVKTISDKIGFKVSSRGWGYQFEDLRIIDKSELDRVQSLINICRKKGYLPLDFVAEESSRKFKSLWEPETLTVYEKLSKYVEDMNERYLHYIPDYWEDEKYYIQVLVEKIDLVTLFLPICKKYRIPIATSKGWSSISQRAELIERFKFHEDAGRIPVLLYCGDLDPAGVAISDTLKKNFADLHGATKWNPYNTLIVDRFGLNYDFIKENNLTWIDNLITGSGREADGSKPHVASYIAKYGRRKVEANALVVRPTKAAKLIENAIIKYIGDDGLERIEENDRAIKMKYDRILEVLEEDIKTIKSVIGSLGEEDSEGILY